MVTVLWPYDVGFPQNSDTLQGQSEVVVEQLGCTHHEYVYDGCVL